MTTPVLVSEQLGQGLNLAAAMNDRTRRAMLNRVVADYKLGDQTIMAAVNKLDTDLRVEIKKALDAAGTLDSGIQKAQLEAIIDRLMQQPAFVAGMGSKTAMVGGELKTLASVFDAQFYRQPRPAREEFVYASEDDAIPSGSVVTLVNGEVSTFTSSVTTSDTNGDGKDDLCVVKFSSTNYGGLAAEWEQALHMIPETFLGQASVTYRSKHTTRVVFDLTPFLVNGSDTPVTGLDVDGNGTTDGSLLSAANAAQLAALEGELVTAIEAETAANSNASAKALTANQAQSTLDAKNAALAAIPEGEDTTEAAAAVAAAEADVAKAQAAYQAASTLAVTKSEAVAAARAAVNAFKAANGIA